MPLAERMIAKIEKDGKMDQEQETRLYLMVLEMQQKYSQALGVSWKFSLSSLGEVFEIFLLSAI